MSYLASFSAYLSGQSDDLTGFSSQVIEGLDKTRSELQKNGSYLDIEGVSAQERIKEVGQYRIHRFVGGYIYGFQKGGIFHVIPGDLSSEQPRQKNELGELVFYMNKETNEIDGIYEPFAGHTWGKKLASKSGGTLKYFLVIFLIVVVAFVASYIWVQIDPSLQGSGYPLIELNQAQ